MKNYTEFLHTESSVTSLEQLFEFYSIENISKDDFLNYKPKGLLSNKEHIFHTYTKQDKKKYSIQSASSVTASNCHIKSPVSFFLPVNRAKNFFQTLPEYSAKDSFIYEAFLGEQIDNILNNPQWNSDFINKNIPEISVFVWCKSLSNNDSIEGSILNLTPWVTNLQTNVTKTGGNFSITLPPLIAQFFQSGNSIDGVSDGVWGIAPSWVRGDGSNLISKSTNVTAEFESRNPIFFKNVISANDVVFISFDTQSTRRTKQTDKGGLLNSYVSSYDLPDNNYDMIALVDSVSDSYESESNSIGISISGRDCMKLLIDDGSFFFPNSYSNPDSKGGVFKNIDNGGGDGINTTNNQLDEDADDVASGRASFRMNLTEIIEAFYNFDDRNIEDVLNTLISTLSNIKICNDSLFTPYGASGNPVRDRRSKFKRITGTNFQ